MLFRRRFTPVTLSLEVTVTDAPEVGRPPIANLVIIVRRGTATLQRVQTAYHEGRGGWLMLAHDVDKRWREIAFLLHAVGVPIAVGAAVPPTATSIRHTVEAALDAFEVINPPVAIDFNRLRAMAPQSSWLGG